LHDTSDQKRQATTAVKASSGGDLIGATGQTKTPLSPYGTVIIDGSEHPAKSESAMIEAGQQVVVIRREAFGLVVRAKPTSPQP
jgi:membrane-bound ClpP family serine protease